MSKKSFSALARQIILTWGTKRQELIHEKLAIPALIMIANPGHDAVKARTVLSFMKEVKSDRVLAMQQWMETYSPVKFKFQAKTGVLHSVFDLDLLPGLIRNCAIAHGDAKEHNVDEFVAEIMTADVGFDYLIGHAKSHPYWEKNEIKVAIDHLVTSDKLTRTLKKEIEKIGETIGALANDLNSDDPEVAAKANCEIISLNRIRQGLLTAVTPVSISDKRAA